MVERRQVMTILPDTKMRAVILTSLVDATLDKYICDVLK